jgi:hypothetical protein
MNPSIFALGWGAAITALSGRSYLGSEASFLAFIMRAMPDSWAASSRV